MFGGFENALPVELRREQGSNVGEMRTIAACQKEFEFRSEAERMPGGAWCSNLCCSGQ